jgi:hypothetical protein
MAPIDRPLVELSREEVLELSTADKLKYFHEVVVRHPRMEEAVDDAMMLSAPNTGTDIILMIGPTGAGKSASIQTIRRKFADAFHSDLCADPGFIPIAAIEAPASGEHSFSWRMLYTRLGHALNEPLLDRKILTAAARQALGAEGRMSSGFTVAALRVSIENALKYRRTRLVVIDEAAHVLANCGEQKLIAHMNALKSLANVSGVTLMLVGSYDLYKLPMLSGQLARRTAVVHMGRYMKGDKRDEECFRRSLRALQKRLPIDPIPDLERYSVNLQVACVGCIGTLKDTLMRALTMTLEKGGKWRDDFLRKAILAEALLAEILEETLEGERLLSKATYGQRVVDWLEPA